MRVASALGGRRVATAVHWLGRSAPWTSAPEHKAGHLTGFDVAYRTPRRMPEPAPVSRRRRRGWFLLGVDLIALGLAVVANALGASAAGVAAGPRGWLALYLVLTVAAIAARRGYRFRLKTSPFEYVGQILAATALAATLIIAARVVLDPDPDAAGQVVRVWAFSTVYLICGRVAAELAAHRSRPGLNTLIIGAGAIGNTLARRLHERPELGLHPIGFLDYNPLIDGRHESHGVPVLGASWDLEDVVRRHAVEHVIVAFSTAPHHVMLRLVRRCRALGLDVSLVPRLFEEMSRRVTIEHVGGIALARVDRTDPRGWQFDVKYGIDRVVGVSLLLLTAPLMLAVAFAVKLSSPGPVFFRQRRVGLDDREFDILKFRTMRVDPEGRENDARWVAETLGVFDEEEDISAEDRRTAIGRFLRRTSLDELPQLLNIVRGQMSLIGPRPERAGCASRFGDHVYRYGDRHRVKSGLTGWAQVNGLRGQTSLQDRIEWDNFYIENWSPWLDLKILLLTPAAIVNSDDS
ncbi:MAG: exopolysaccharide biosynthesis polyprenyl glycosylphosphotransferase [Solirubrobacteraceae bacterium]